MQSKLIIVLAVSCLSLVAQKTTGESWKDVENALPRRGATSLTNAASPVPSASIDWQKANDRMTEAMINAADTPAEPWAMWYLANFKFESGELDESQNLLISLQQRFPKHALNTARLGKNGRTLMQDALDDVSEEQSFKKRHPRKPIPLPVLADAPSATIRFVSGDVTIRFFPNVAPKHAERFLENCHKGLYDGTRVTRVNDNTVTAGDPMSREGMNPDPRGISKASDAPASIPHEFSGLTHRRGMVSMLRNPVGNDSGASTFCFIMKDFTALDLQQTPFAEVVSGMEVLDAMTRMPRAQGEAPSSTITIRAVAVNDKAVPPETPEKK